VTLALEVVGDLSDTAADAMAQRHWPRIERGYHAGMHPDSTAKEVLADDAELGLDDLEDTVLFDELPIIQFPGKR
jgi:hypothetical protein